MDRRSSLLAEIMAEARESLVAGRPLRRAIGDGKLHIDRPLPFLVLHRRRSDDAGTDTLLHGQGSYLIAGEDLGTEDLAELLKSIVEPLADRFGSFLIVELWAGPVPPTEASQAPRFRVAAERQEGELPNQVRRLLEGLHEVGAEADLNPAVETTTDDPIAPEGMEPVLDADTRRELGCVLLGVEVPPVYRDEGGTLFPQVLREMTRDVTKALHRAAFTFVQVQTRFEPEDFRELGRRKVLALGWETDKLLTGVGRRLDFLLNVTPVNARSAWDRFEADGYEHPPLFHYRPLAFDPDLIKRELFAIELERVEDPTLAYLLREKRNELDRMITMLEDRESERFLHGSISLYGAAETELLALAEALLSRSGPDGDREQVGPEAILERASSEIEKYRASWPEMQAQAEIRPDVPGVMVVHGTLLIGAEARIGAHRVEPLVHHEVGTHIVTAQNGSAQPLKLLSVGLPGYEETQEGLAVFAEYAIGGLGVDRLRVLAGRVIAVARMVAGVPFVEVFDELHRTHGFDARQAWMMTMRVYRGGGLTKDAIYLRGFTALLDHLASGGALEPLFVGKMSLEHVPLVEELLWREVLEEPPLKPLWLEGRRSHARLERARAGVDVLDLVA